MQKQLDAIARLLNHIEIEGDVVDWYWCEPDPFSYNELAQDPCGKQTDHFKKLIADARKALHQLEKMPKPCSCKSKCRQETK
jgi:hypothetical protein